MNKQPPYFEHSAWVGPLFTPGEGTCIVGYSHYTKRNERDRPSLTVDVMNRVVAGDFGGSAFWCSIASYFGQGGSSANVCSFWNSVLFFNFLPQAVGTAMFATGKKAQHESAAIRFRRLVGEHRPARVFVFSKKAWEALPKMEEEKSGHKLPRTNTGDQWGTYLEEYGQRVVTVGLRHPLYAPGNKMAASVQAALRL